MNLEHEDEKLEAYLRKFRPQVPSPLPATPLFVLAPIVRVVAGLAAVVLIALTLFLLRGTHRQQAIENVSPAVQHEPAVQDISLMRLSRIMREDPEKLNAQLDQLSTQLLPDVQSGEGVLEHLAR